jgi:integrase
MGSHNQEKVLNPGFTVYLKNEDYKKINPHSFRYTHALLMFEAGAIIKEVMKS